MTGSVHDLRLLLEAACNSDPTLRSDNAVRELVGILAQFDAMSIDDFFARLMGRKEEAVKPKLRPPVEVDEIVSRLKSALPSDDAFHRVMDGLAHKKSVTKPLLTRVFYALFDRSEGVPKRATRSELLRLIEDERNILVRNDKMGQLLGRRIVSAE